MADIRLVDVSLRDGNQSLWGATGLTTAQMLEIAPTMDRIGFKAIDFTSSTHMAVAVRYFQENPWERIRRMRALMPNTPLQFITTGLRFISWEQSDADFMRLVYRKLIENGIRRFIMLDPMHDMDALLSAAKLVREEGGEDIMAALTYTLSAVHDDAFYANLARTIRRSPYFDRVYIKDPAGLLTPERARTLVPAVKAELGDMPLEMHCHCTIGLGPLAYQSVADQGIDAMHVAVGPLANGTSLPSATRLVANLREAGHRVDIDDRLLARVADYFTRLSAAEGLPVGTPQEYDASFLRHQVAGGVMTTMRRQLSELGLEHRFPDVMAEVERVRAELGYPIMVTPFPQMVCGQALFNVIGKARYDNVSDQVIRYVMGRFGRPTAPVDPDIEDRILNRPRAREIAGEPLMQTLSDLRRKIGSHYSDEEFLLRAVMPEDQVNAMAAAGAARDRYSPEAKTVKDLLKGLSERTAPTFLQIKKPGFAVSVRQVPAKEGASADA